MLLPNLAFRERLGLPFGDCAVDGFRLRVERLDVNNFSPRRTCVSPVDRMPVVMQKPPGLHFPPCRTCVSTVDRIVEAAGNAIESTAISNGHTSSTVEIDVEPLKLSIAAPNLLTTSGGAVGVADRFVELPRSGFGTTDRALSIDTSDDIRGSRVRTLVDFFCWAQPLIDDIGVSDTR